MPIVKINTKNTNTLSDNLFEEHSITQLFCNSTEYKRFIKLTPENIHSFNIPALQLSNIEKFIGDKNVDVSQFSSITKNLRSTIVNSLKEGGLTEISNRIDELQELEVLDLSNNQLQNLPKNIGNLTSLKILILANNNIKELPDSISSLKSLELIDLTDNPISSPPDFLFKIKKLTEAEEKRKQLKKQLLESIKKDIASVAEIDKKEKSIGIQIGRRIKIEYALFGDKVIVQ